MVYKDGPGTIRGKPSLLPLHAPISDSTEQDPAISKRVLQLVVELGLHALPAESDIYMTICREVLDNRVTAVEGASTYHEALRELQALEPREIQKIASAHSDKLLVRNSIPPTDQ